MNRIEWTGEHLKNLVTLDKTELQNRYPEYAWGTLKRTRNKKLAAIRAGRIADPRKVVGVDMGKGESYSVEQLLDSTTGMPVIDLAEQLIEAKRLIKKAHKDLDEARDGKSEYIAALRAAFQEATEDIKLNIPVAQPPLVLTHDALVQYRKEEVAVVCISDLQLGKVTTTYDMDVCAERMRTLAEKVIQTAQTQATHHPIRELHIQMLGDIVEGEDIFPNQAYQISAGNYRQMNRGWTILVEFILTMLTFFERIHVIGVVGNHGRISSRGGNIDPETNMDRMLYDRLRGTFNSPVYQDKRVTFNVPDGTGLRSWYAVDRIGDWGFLLCHGDQINGWAGIPFYGTQKKALGWIDAIDEPWDYLMMGHFHTPTMLTYGKRKAYYNGTTESSNEFAQERIAATGSPSQNLFFVSPQTGITSWHEIQLDETPSNLERARKIAEQFKSPY